MGKEGDHASTTTMTTTTTTPEDVGQHVLALFYRSVDSCLSDSIRKHGIDGVKRAFVRLVYWRSRPAEEDEDGEEDRRWSRRRASARWQQLASTSKMGMHQHDGSEWPRASKKDPTVHCDIDGDDAPDENRDSKERR